MNIGWGLVWNGKGKRPLDGMLYTTTYVRPRTGVGLLVKVTGLEETKWQEESHGLLSLGGEGRAATYTVLDSPVFWPESQKGSKLYLATPTQFDEGWQAGNWKDYFAGANQLKSAAVRRHQLIGGWDLANERPKPMKRYVPAGAVYTFSGELETSEVEQPICDDKDAGRIGFGTAFVGR